MLKDLSSEGEDILKRIFDENSINCDDNIKARAKKLGSKIEGAHVQRSRKEPYLRALIGNSLPFSEFSEEVELIIKELLSKLYDNNINQVDKIWKIAKSTNPYY